MQRLVTRFLIYCGLLLVLTSCLSPISAEPCDRSKPTPTVQGFPVYPGAQQVQFQDIQTDTPRRVIAFQVVDKPEAVVAWYRDVLTRNGWENDQETPEPNSLDFSWTNNCLETTYSFDGTLEPRNDGKTDVNLTIRTIHRD
jgi:hypothetical protein